MRVKPRRSTTAVLLFVIFLLPSVLRSQETGQVVGLVADSATRAALTSVLVEITRADGATSRSTLTGPSGTFRIAGVTPGEYSVTAVFPGWEAIPPPAITIDAGTTLDVTIRMVERPYRLNPLTVSASRTREKALDAPASVQVVQRETIERRPALTVVEHVRDQTAVDYMATGLQGSYVVVRGFNNVFSGATLMMTDNRIARVPSLRANISYFNPITSLDLDRTEVILGPASALYGPNAEQGVIHSFTRSPIDDPGIGVSLAGGIREQPAVADQAITTGEDGVVHLEGRAAFRLSEKVGAKVSGQYFSAPDFRYADAEEERQRNTATACLDGGLELPDPACLNFADGLEPTDPADLAELARRVERVADGRDEDLERWTVDARIDWRPDPETRVVLAGGRATAVSSVDLTGLGAAQVVDWAYDYAQARLRRRDLFAQVFLNRSLNDGSYLLRSGKTLVDRSRLLAAQLQHSTRLGDRNRIVYGADYMRTTPVTDGTINGRNEDDDTVDEIGGYAQWESSLARQLDLVLAARLDKNSRLADPVFSPRAALVYRPRPGHSVRLTFNRAFSTPNTISMFLDLSGGTVPLGGSFRYDIRAQGSTDTGFTFRRADGIPMHRSPFATLVGAEPLDFLPTTTASLWDEGVAVTQALAAAGELDPALARLLLDLSPPDESQVSVAAAYLNPDAAAGASPFDPAPGGLEAVRDIAPLEPGSTSTLEAGYKGLFEERFLVSASAWYSRVSDRISALRVISPNVFLDGPSLGAYLAGEFTARVGTEFPDEQAALEAAAAVTQAMAQLPLGVVAPEQAGGSGASIVMTDRNLTAFDLFGFEVAFAFFFSDLWRMEGTASWVSDDSFVTGAGPTAEVVALNAPGLKGSAAVSYRDPAGGLDAVLRVRGVKGFPASSGVYGGRVDDYGVVDVSLGYRLRGTGLWLQLSMQNLLDSGYSTFPGAPTLGRLTMLRLRYDLPRI